LNSQIGGIKQIVTNHKNNHKLSKKSNFFETNSKKSIKYLALRGNMYDNTAHMYAKQVKPQRNYLLFTLYFS